MAVDKRWSKNPDVHRRLYTGSRGRDVKQLQTALNVRLKRKGYKGIAVDGEFGPSTRTAWATMAKLLGFNHRRCTEGNQRYMRRPWDRPAYMKRREKKRYAALRKRRAGGTGPDAAVRWWNSHLNVKEQPWGSNGGPGISGWQREFGFGRVAWCGIFLGKGLRAAGVKVTSRVAGVALIEEDAKRGLNGFRSWHGSRNGIRGDAAVIGGYGVHVEGVIERHSWGYKTAGGNTSCEGCTGSQSNGGQSARRNRGFGVVRGCARPAYRR